MAPPTVASQDELKIYDDLKNFLAATRVDLRKAATEAVLQVVDREGMEKLIKHGFVFDLAKNASYPDGEVSLNALKGLVHLSSQVNTGNQCIIDLMEAGGLNRMTEIVLSRPEEGETMENWRQRVNNAMALLANLTRIEAGALEMAGRTMPVEAVKSEDLSEDKVPTKPTLELMLSRFLNPQYLEDVDFEELENAEALDSNSADPYQHFAAVLMNSTQVEAGRKFVVKIHRKDENDEGTTVLQSILGQLRSPNPLRRRGIAGTIRNCCLNKESAWWLLNIVGITKHILYPLAGPEELDVDEKQGLDPDLWLEGPDKKREPDYLTRLQLVESILLLCSSGRKSREHLRLDRCYVILKWADMVEEHEDVSANIFECVQYLRRDEHGTAEGSSDKFVEEHYKKASVAQQVGVSEDLDDVD